jgi:hypothetical protein
MLDLSRVFARFISYTAGQAASKPVASAIAFREELKVLEEFLLWNHFQGKKMSTETTEPALYMFDGAYMCSV